MTEITPARLRTLFEPRSVALIGASNKSIFSQIAFANLEEFGVLDRTFLVNRRGAETHGRATVTSCAEIGEPVDVALMMVPQAGTLDAMSEAAAAGVRNVLILSSGYGEAGEEGRRAQAELIAHARSLDMLLLGPNHLGFINFTRRMPVAAIPSLPQRDGPVALLSQSGGSCSQMISFATMCDIGLSKVVTLGNEAMISSGHVLDYLVDDEHTRAIAIFAEEIREPDVFRAAARRAAHAGKAVVVLKAGRSALAARTAAAHTGAFVGDDRVIDAVFAELGVIRVDTVEDMLLTSATAARLGRLPRPGIGIVSVSGGACDIVADTAQLVDAQIPDFSPETTAELTEILPSYGTALNPLDTPGGILDPSIFTRAIETVSRDPSIGVVAVIQTVPWISDGRPYLRQPLVDATGEGIARAHVPVAYINQTLQPVTDYTRAIMDAGNVPSVIPGLWQAIFALGRIGWWSGVLDELEAGDSGGVAVPGVDAGAPGDGAWSEWRARELLSAAGVPFVPGALVTDPARAEEAVAQLGASTSAYAVKVVSPEILHKSDIGAVSLDVPAASLGDACARVIAAGRGVPGAVVQGALVTPMRRGGLELLVGVVRDPRWGPILAVGLGGVFTEVLGDTALASLPVSVDRVVALLRGLRGAALLDGVRGGRPVDVRHVAEVIARIGALALALGDDLQSLEINPLRVDGGEVEALDVVVEWRGRRRPSSAAGRGSVP